MPRLHEAAAAGNLEKVEEYLNAGDPINDMTQSVTSKGETYDFSKHVGTGTFGRNMTPLHIASYAGRTNVVRFLLQRGADPELRDAWHNCVGDTALEIALEKKNVGLATVLVQMGANDHDGLLKKALEKRDHDAPEGTLIVETGNSEIVEGSVLPEFARLSAVASRKSYLDLRGMDLDDTSAKSIAAFITEQKTEILNISSNSFTEQGMAVLAEALRGNNYLRVLSMANNPLGDQGIKQLALALSENNRLLELDISSCEFRQDGAGALADMLTVNKSLIGLQMNGNSLDAQGLLFISETLNRSNLQMLGLERSSRSRYGCDALYRVVEENSHLVELNMAGCNTDYFEPASIQKNIQRNRSSLEEKIQKLGANAADSEVLIIQPHALTDDICEKLLEALKKTHLRPKISIIGYNKVTDDFLASLSSFRDRCDYIDIVGLDLPVTWESILAARKGNYDESFVLDRNPNNTLNIDDYMKKDSLGTHIELDASKITKAKLSDILEKLSEVDMPLKFLKLSHYESLETPLIKKLAYAVSRLSINSLIVDIETMDDYQIHLIMESIGRNSKIEMLSLGLRTLSSDGARIISDFIASNLKITHLFLDKEEYGQTEKKILFEGIEKNKSITDFDMKGLYSSLLERRLLNHIEHIRKYLNTVELSDDNIDMARTFLKRIDFVKYQYVLKDKNCGRGIPEVLSYPNIVSYSRRRMIQDYKKNSTVKLTDNPYSFTTKKAKMDFQAHFGNLVKLIGLDSILTSSIEGDTIRIELSNPNELVITKENLEILLVDVANEFKDYFINHLNLAFGKNRDFSMLPHWNDREYALTLKASPEHLLLIQRKIREISESLFGPMKNDSVNECRLM